MAGSTAPPITSPILAWPSRPSHDRTPLSTLPSSSSFPSLLTHESESSASTSHTAMSSSTTLLGGSVTHHSWGSGKGKERASLDVEDDEDVFRRPRYPPPKKPLSPRQLGRIAQSFGIVIPSLPMPSPVSSPNPGVSTPPSRSRAHAGLATPNIVHSPYLLTVVPPLSLLAVKGGSAEEAEKRTKRWKRGRLVPLQPTLSGMLLAIAREYGLPSTKGVNVYLSHRDDRSSSSSHSSYAGSSPPYDEASGPQISSQTWSTLYGSYLVNSLSRSPTPSSTPLRSAGPLGKDIGFPASPLSLLSKPKDAPLSTPLKSTFPLPGNSAVAPFTPQSTTTAASHSVPNPIIGTIEFDVDEDIAGWYDDFRKSGHRRKLSSLSDNGTSTTGIRELRLVRNANKARDKRHLQELDANLPRSAGNSPYEPSRRSISASEAMALFSTSKTMPRPSGSLSRAGSAGEMSDHDTTLGSIDNSLPPEMMEMLGEQSHSESDELLASPIELDQEEEEVSRGARLSQQEIVDHIKAELEKRGSAMVMSDQLDDLEKIMRSLSPREIRLTSPRMLTPRMAAKVANLQFPPNPTLKPRASAAPGKSPLGSSFNANSSASEESGASRARAEEPVPSWPAVPFVKLPNDSPGSPSSLEGYIRETSRPPNDRSPISEETLSRMKEIAPSPPPKEDWKPRRPVRPPSPNLGPTKIIPHSLDPDMLDVLRSPGKDEEAQHRVRRSPSISLKSFRNLGGKKKRDESPPVAPASGTSATFLSKETVGLWKGSVSPSSSTFPGLKGPGTSSAGSAAHRASHATTASEFGSIDEHTMPSSATLPAKGDTRDSGKGLGRFFGSGWGRRPSESPKSAGRPTNSHQFGYHKSNPSIDSTHAGSGNGYANGATPASIISAPIPDSFIHHQATRYDGSSPSTTVHGTSGPAAGGAYSPDASGTLSGHRKTPTVSSFADSASNAGRASSDVASPRSVRRKPVPGQAGQASNSPSVDLDAGMGMGSGVKGSFSMGSVNSFVLEDPPKRRVPKGMALI